MYLSKIDALRREKYFKTTQGKRMLKLMSRDTLTKINYPRQACMFARNYSSFFLKKIRLGEPVRLWRKVYAEFVEVRTREGATQIKPLKKLGGF